MKKLMARLLTPWMLVAGIFLTVSAFKTDRIPDESMHSEANAIVATDKESLAAEAIQKIKADSTMNLPDSIMMVVFDNDGKFSAEIITTR